MAVEETGTIKTISAVVSCIDPLFVRIIGNVKHHVVKVPSGSIVVAVYEENQAFIIAFARASADSSSTVVHLATAITIVVGNIVRFKATKNEDPYKHFFPFVVNVIDEDAGDEGSIVDNRITSIPSMSIDVALLRDLLEAT